MLYLNVISIALLMAGSAVLWQQMDQIAESARVYPQILIGLVMLFGLLTIAREFYQKKTPSSLNADIKALFFAPGPIRTRTLTFVLIWVLYPLVMDYAGFLISTVLALSLSLWLLKIRRVWVGILSAIGFTLALAVLFETVLYIPVPGALLDQVLSRIIYTL